MDKSELFIKQCDCPEVQGQRKPKVEKMKDGRWHYEWDLEDGDFIATKDIYEKEKIQIEVKGTTIYSPYFYSTRKDAKIDISIVGFDEGDGYQTKKFTWLPRQDQIQEMILRRTFISPARLQDHFTKWIESKDLYDFGMSIEQLWVHFYMDKKHSKTWDSKGEKWVKE